MKKFYVLIVVCIGLCIQGFGQTFTWEGGPSGNWNNDANWSGTGIPSTSSHSVLFTANTIVSLDVDNVQINSLSVEGPGNAFVTIASSGNNRILRLSGTTTVAPAININSTNTLRFTTESSTDLEVYMGDDAKGTINGTLSLSGFSNVNKAALVIGENADLLTKVNVLSGGKIVVEPNGLTPFSLEDYLNFNPGSTLELKNDGPIIPIADFAMSSEIVISGVVNQGMGSVANAQVGNLTYNCPNQEPGVFAVMSLNFGPGFIVEGDLKIENTNNNPLILMENQSPFPGQTLRELTIKGDLNIQGDSYVILANDADNELPFKITVEGDVLAGGTVFGLQNSDENTIQTTTLIVKGNIQHTNGEFNPHSTGVNESVNLFTIEMNGSGPTTQTISSSQNTFDNGTKQLTLKINNTGAGVTLQTPLIVGRLNLTAGKLNTSSSNPLTINNTSEESIVLVSSPGSFVDGPVRRVVASTNELIFPTGNGSVKRPISVIPTSNTMTTFEARYINAGSGNNSFAAPLDGIEQNYYWDVQRIGAGADAQVRLTLNGAISGADAGDAIVPARFDGTNWVRRRGPVDGFIAPGDATTGVARTDDQTSFGSYTFGYGVQASVLPINLESFNAKKVNSSTQLNWKISENSNPVSFEVMKSADGINFSKIGTVSAFEGKLNYDFIDNSLLAGNNYYRLRMLDKDGKISFSSIVVVMNGTKGVMISSMIPTMVIDRARLNITSSVKGNMQLVVTDISGRIIQNQNVSIDSGNQQVWLNASRLSSGIYQVTGYINGEKTATMRFFKR